MKFVAKIEKKKLNQTTGETESHYEPIEKYCVGNGSLHAMYVLIAIFVILAIAMVPLAVCLGVYVNKFYAFLILAGFVFAFNLNRLFDILSDMKIEYAYKIHLFDEEMKKAKKENNLTLIEQAEWHKAHPYATAIKYLETKDMKNFDEIIKNLMKNA